MDSRDEATLPTTRPQKSRQSVSHLASDSMDKENMTTDIGGLMGTKRIGLGNGSFKKSRSKSIGPGGPDALKGGTGNRRKSIVAPPPKSILKPTMPPLREIPAHVATRKPSPKKAAQSPTKAADVQISNFLLDQPAQIESRALITGTEGLANPFAVESNPAVVETRVMLRTEEEQQAAVKEREMKESMQAETDLKSRREARRKSLANRRVSFAPEATLHTWDVVEYLQDSTTSSASTNSTRRPSSASIATPETSRHPSSDPSEPPSTPPEQIEDTITASPEHQRDLHQKKRRRSSAIPPLNFNNPDDEVFSSSPSSGSSTGGDDDNVDQAASDENISDSDSDSDNEGTAMSIDVGDNTNMSSASIKSIASSTGSSVRLEEALRLAAQQAGTQGIEFDEHGGLGIAEEEEEIVSFLPWSKGGRLDDAGPSIDQENLNPFSPAFKNGLANQSNDEDNDGITMEMTQAVGKIIQSPQSDEGTTMDMTVAMGGIMVSQPVQSASSRRKTMQSARRKSTRRRSSGESSSLEDETMDLTMAIGGIQGSKVRENTEGLNEDEEMTMEFTSVIGGVLALGDSSILKTQKHASMTSPMKSNPGRRSVDSAAVDDSMDMTVAVGARIPTYIPDENDATFCMDFTADLGSILSKQASPQRRSPTKPLSEEQHIVDSCLQKIQGSTVASETGSPSLAPFKGKGLRRSVGPRASTTPKSSIKRVSVGTPINKSSTPLKQVTPKSPRQATSAKSISPKPLSTTPSEKLHNAGETKVSTPETNISKSSTTPNRLFQKDVATGIATPHIVLTPQKRRSSGIGIDRAGLGSPRVAAILDRRVSIGDSALAFTLGNIGFAGHGVRFDDPQTMSHELDGQVQDDRGREDERKIVEREADSDEVEKDATVNLKELIKSLTPKKRTLKGRKSLHVGAAKGLLGKRPVELDENDEDDENCGGTKRFKNQQGSPVKNIKLQAPPSKAETTGRLTRAARRSETSTLNIITAMVSSTPLKVSNISTPKSQGRYRDLEPQSSAHLSIPFVEKGPAMDPIINDGEYADERMHLQDFLNMTSIRFMELNTTKRRHTVAPSALQTGGNDLKNGNCDTNDSFESCVVAGACTIPMLELFQHSCRELKKYISEGRKVVREIETDTFEENPPLFREYISATPDFRALMDNQFKNVKTHARLLSKATWYEWRMKLLDGLKDGLYKTREGMEADSEMLQHQQNLLDSVIPSLIREYESVAAEESELQVAAEELAKCDQKELSEARRRLVSIEADVEAKKNLIRNLQSQLHEKELAIVATTEKKQACHEDIQEAEKVRELCRGWSADEGLAFKAKVDGLEERHGWAITGVSGHQVSMTFRRDIELVFDASSFKPNKADATPLESVSSRIDLWYIAANRKLNALPLTTEKDFFLQNIREHCRGLPQAQTTVKSLLDAVSMPWVRALDVVNNIRTLQHDCPIEISKISDSSIVIRSALLLIPLSTKVDLEFHVQIRSTDNGFDVDIDPKCFVCYGEHFNEAKMTEFLINRIAMNGEDKRSWGDIVAELELRLLARGRK